MLETTISPVLEEHPSDLVISVYPHFNAAVAAHYRGSERRPRLMTVVTDLGAVHRAWFSRGDDYYTAPTAVARRKAIRSGVHPRRVITTGMPVHPSFGAPRADATTLRRELGWRPDLPALLLLGGGAGVGQIEALAQALDSGHLAGAAMDVGRAPDQMPSPALARRPDVIATPHIGGLTPEAIQHQAFDTVRQVEALTAGKLPPGSVNAEAATRLSRLGVTV